MIPRRMLALGVTLLLFATLSGCTSLKRMTKTGTVDSLFGQTLYYVIETAALVDETDRIAYDHEVYFRASDELLVRAGAILEEAEPERDSGLFALGSHDWDKAETKITVERLKALRNEAKVLWTQAYADWIRVQLEADVLYIMPNITVGLEAG